MFTKILIANRGEIACRIIETAHKMGIRCVAVFSDADQDARHVAMADEAYHIGGSPSKDSYLRADKILEVAKKSGAQAVHPGYGFMSENPIFAQACTDSGIKFIGPPVGAIEAMGSKSAAKDIMAKANVPLVPGYHGDNQDENHLKSEADKMGYPVLLKAAFGGGGKGMRVVNSEGEFFDMLASAKREAMSGFSNDTMLLEKYLTQPRHVEIQVFTDEHGNGVYLAERDCSIQRRHQKVIEEAPAPNISDEVRVAMGEAAVRAAQAIDYEGAGTVEFLFDVDGSFYFMEMNTRLQVEHPVTEMITGQDLVKWQLMVAFGLPLPMEQKDVTVEGHAFEVRIYAEDPDNEFLPATGKLHYLRQPEQSRHVRVDTGVRENDEVSTFYDPMIAKLIVWDENRERALARMLRALDDYRISGLKTNLSFLTSLLEHQAFADIELETCFIEKHHDSLFSAGRDEDTQATALAALFLMLKSTAQSHDLAGYSQDKTSPWHQFGGWRMNMVQTHQLTLTDANDKSHDIVVRHQDDTFSIVVDGKTIKAQGKLVDDHLVAKLNDHNVNVRIAHHDDWVTVFNKQNTTELRHVTAQAIETEDQAEEGSLTAPMNGTIVSVLCKAGDTVLQDQNLVIMEAMKMEYTIKATADGTINEVFYGEGDLVADGALLIDFTANEEIVKEKAEEAE
jgi:3-methylcrotonyl-CoA carboxylase alpha subunit